MKAVIPPAGMATRMRPATKSMPKDTFSVVDKPVTKYVVEEAGTTSCDENLNATSREKRANEDNCNQSCGLGRHLKGEKGEYELLSQMEDICYLADIDCVRLKEPLGLRTALVGDFHCIHLGANP